MTEHERMIEARHAEILQQLANNRAVIDAIFVELQTIGDTLESLTKMAERPLERTARTGAPLSSDELYREARAAVLEAGKASTSYLQRRLGVGYTRAAALLDQLEEMGVIGPAEGAKPRRVLITPENASDV